VEAGTDPAGLFHLGHPGRANLSGRPRYLPRLGDCRRVRASWAQPAYAFRQVELDPGPDGGHLAEGLTCLLLIIRDAQRDGTWSRLKVCGNPDCQWAFYDRSHSRRGAWCDMASCGNLIKNRNLRARRGPRQREPA
jgi:predicted RNA-binding Zn ribbon-like protein